MVEESVEEIWSKIDVKKVGACTKRQCKEAVKKVMSSVGLDKEFDEALFEKLFALVDVDSDDALEKKEVVDIIMMIITGKNETK